MKETILILGGDARNEQLCRLMETDGRPVRHLPALPDGDALRTAIEQAAILVLPTPVSRGEALTGDRSQTPWQTVFPLFLQRQHVFGGGFSTAQRVSLQARAVRFTDFLDCKRFVRYNAALTAQGALRLLLENTAQYLPQQRVLIAGYGNVGQETARWLCGVGCRCTIAARRDTQRTAAKTAGCGAIAPDEAKRTIGQFDVLVNTIPARWLDAKSLSGAKPGGVYLELAGAPFGTEKDAALQCGLCYIDGKGLPGRFCPQAAAEAMKHCIDAT